MNTLNSIEYIKELPDYPKYYITNYGNVYSTKQNKIKKLKLQKGKYYLTVGLTKNKKTVTKPVHHLVALAFYNYKTDNRSIVIDHFDENKHNNNLNNLFIRTQRFNMAKHHYQKRKIPFGITQMPNKKYKAQITVKYKKYCLGFFNTIKEASARYEEAVQVADDHLHKEIEKYIIDYTGSIPLNQFLKTNKLNPYAPLNKQ